MFSVFRVSIDTRRTSVASNVKTGTHCNTLHRTVSNTLILFKFQQKRGVVDALELLFFHWQLLVVSRSADSVRTVCATIVE